MRFKLQKNMKRKLITITLLLALIGVPVLSFISMDFMGRFENNNSLDKNKNFSDDQQISTSQGIGEDPWWNATFKWRQPLNITNPTDQKLTNWKTYIKFNHTKYVQSGKMQDDLGDIRIVENDQLRKYYFTTEYPHGDYAYVWFETNVDASASDYDTYLYYGNSDATPLSQYYDSDAFGTAWYGFNKEESDKAVDRLGRYNASINGLGTEVGYVPGYVSDYALDFNNSQTTAYIDVPTNVINGSSDFTICFWATEQEDTDAEYIISGASGSDYNHMLMHGPDEPGWHFYVWIRNSSGTHIYRDLVQADSLIYSNPGDPVEISPGGLIIAQEQDSLGGGFVASQAFSGKMDELRFFNDSLSWGELSWLKNNYSLNVNSIGEQERGANVKITVRDIDGRPVPEAEVSLTNDSAPLENRTVSQKYTTDKGVAIFDKMRFGEYNISIKYYLNNGTYTYVRTLYNSSELTDAALNFQGLEYNETIQVDIWTVEFEVDDFDGDPMDYGYILIYNDTSTDPLLANLTLDSGTGKAIFRWLNRSSYYYEVYYQNGDYATKDNLITRKTIIRESKASSITKNLNNTVSSQVGNSFSSQFEIFAEDSSSTQIGKYKLISSNITLSNINEYLLDLKVEYLKSKNSWETLLEKEYDDFETSDDLNINVFDNYDAYGLRFIIDFYNGSAGSTNNGICTVNYTETTHEQITANMSKLEIYAYDKSEESQPIENLDIRIRNASSDSGNSIINLTTNSLGEAIDSNGLPFWYFHGDYNISLYFYGAKKSFQITESDEETFPSGGIFVYNYTLDNASTLELNVTLNIENFQSKFVNLANTTSAMWSEAMFFAVNYTISEDGGDTWKPIEDPDYVRYEVTELGKTKVLKSGQMDPSGNEDGNYSTTLNSGDFVGGKNYKITISGHKIGYVDPSDKVYDFTITSKPTTLEAYNYTSPGKVTEYYNELINLTFAYNDTIDNELRTTDTFSYSWFYGSGSLQRTEGNYYFFELNTTHNTGSYTVQITATKENYTAISESFILEIEPRPTNINNTVDPIYNYKLDIFEARNFTLEYNDTLNSKRISGCDILYFNWWKLDENGERTYNPGEYGERIKNVTETNDNLYSINFNTEQKSLGEYSLAVHIGKGQNYVEQTIDFFISIEKRTFSSPNLSDLDTKTRTVDQGDSVNIQINLTDTSAGRDGQPLENATVILEGGGQRIELDMVQPGVYEGSIPTSGRQTFFQEQTITYTLNVSKANYESQEITFNVKVKMMSIGPVPIFYLVLGISFSVAIVGALGTYRYIQIARIPEFVKRTRNIKKEIKKGKSISDKYLYQSKKEYIAEWYGEDWEELGLSIEDSLGLGKGSKKKPGEETMKGGAK